MERPSACVTKARFFVEEHPEVLGSEPRPQVLNRILNPETCNFLEERGWGISLAMIELDGKTASLIGQINKSFPNLPITAWIVVNDSDGYWTNRYNIAATRKKVEEVKAWANRFDLRFEALGFDLEPPISLMKSFVQRNPRAFMNNLVQNSQTNRQQRSVGYKPRADLGNLVSDLHKEGIPTHSYELPDIFDRSILGVVNSRRFGTRVTMVYSTQGLPASIERRIPDLALKPGTFPAIGVYSSTGHNPGRNLGEGLKSPINPKTLRRDIKTLRRKAQRENLSIMSDIWVFALTDLEVAKWAADALA